MKIEHISDQDLLEWECVKKSVSRKTDLAPPIIFRE